MFSLLLFHSALPEFLEPLFRDSRPLDAKTYSEVFRGLLLYACESEGDLFHAVLRDCLLHAENPFSLACESGELPEPGSPLYRAALHDCSVLSEILKTGAENFRPDDSLPLWSGGGAGSGFFDGCRTGEDLLQRLVAVYGTGGCGIFSRGKMFRYLPAGPVVVPSSDPVSLDDFIGYKDQREAVLGNTERLLKGLPAQNILLYGDRGSGKSSTVKAVVNRYAKDGLRLVELSAGHLELLPDLLVFLGGRGLKFIVFLDDLSFNGDSPGYRVLKSVLEGGAAVFPDNVVLYATSNRRHLLPEFFSEREGDEISVRDTGEEKLSLADRFGITVSFFRPDQDGYLEIVRGLVKRRGIDLPEKELRVQALRWEKWGKRDLSKNGQAVCGSACFGVRKKPGSPLMSLYECGFSMEWNLHL